MIISDCPPGVLVIGIAVGAGNWHGVDDRPDVQVTVTVTELP